MAKGFTVKAKAPQKQDKEPEWDYDAAREMLKGKAIVFCLPGRGLLISIHEVVPSTEFRLGSDGRKYSDLSRLQQHGELRPL